MNNFMCIKNYPNETFFGEEDKHEKTIEPADYNFFKESFPLNLTNFGPSLATTPHAMANISLFDIFVVIFTQL